MNYTREIKANSDKVLYYEYNNALQTDHSIWPEGEKQLKNPLTSCCLNDWQSYQRNRKEENSCLEKHCDRLLKGLLEVRPDVPDMPEMAACSSCQSFLSEMQRNGMDDIFKQFPHISTKFMQHNTNLKIRLRLVVTSLTHQNVVRSKFKYWLLEKFFSFSGRF